MTLKSKFWVPISLILLVLAILIGLSWGAMDISFNTMFSIFRAMITGKSNESFNLTETEILMNIRMPRVLMSAVIGAGLATGGAAMQGVFRNPLVDASLIGISSGASFFASLFILFSSSLPWLGSIAKDFTLSIFAFLGAVITALVVLRIAYSQGKVQTTTLLLGGVAITAICGACTGLLFYFANDSQLRDLTFWTLGSLGGANWQKLLILLPIISLSILILQWKAVDLNAFTLGESAANYMGVSTKKTKLIVVLATTFMVGASVSFVGIIGFVGLIVPHLVRFLVGSDYKLVIFFSAVFGAFLVTIADVIARTLLAPIELPIGIVTAIIGSPFFLSLIIKNKRELAI